MKLVFSAEAQADLLRIGDYIAADNPARAVAFVTEIQSKCHRLLEHPLMYPLAPRHESSGVRRATHGRYLIFYRVNDHDITIIHIVSGLMDFETLLF